LVVSGRFREEIVIEPYLVVVSKMAEDKSNLKDEGALDSKPPIKNVSQFCMRYGLARPTYTTKETSNGVIVTFSHPGFGTSWEVECKEEQDGKDSLNHQLLPKAQEVLAPYLLPLKEDAKDSKELMKGVKVTKTAKLYECDTWLTQNLLKSKDLKWVLWDTEFVDRIEKSEDGSRERRRATLGLTQIMVPGQCLLFHHQPGLRLPSLLRTVLEAPNVVKYCYNPNMDCIIMYHNYNCNVQGVVDIRDLILPSCIYGNLTSLTRLVEGLLGYRMTKEKKVSTSDWCSWPLTPEQEYYAVMDVCAGLELTRYLCGLRGMKLEEGLKFEFYSLHGIPGMRKKKNYPSNKGREPVTNLVIREVHKTEEGIKTTSLKLV